eukprot:GILI01014406.1.p1 GENE.GILI01014406.1~~GILI01014406.1.p1  ORF type:complete len:921 (-),score=20.54 GILI01014406.1:27-2546(-)
MAHRISQWLGVSTFLLGRSKSCANVTKSESCLLLSYISVACDTLDLPIPCFSPVGDSHQEAFVGYARNGQRISRYTLDSYPDGVPPQCQFISGQTDLLQLNLGLQSRICEDDRGSSITVDCERFYYIPLNSANWKSKSLSSREGWEEALRKMNDQCLEKSGDSTLPFGPTTCPVARLGVGCHWAALNEQELVDTPTRSDFDILSASYKGGDPITRRCTASLKCQLDNPYGLTFHAADRLSSISATLIGHLRAVAVSNGAVSDTTGIVEQRATIDDFKRIVSDIFQTERLPPSSVTRNCVSSLWDGLPFQSVDPRVRYIPNSFSARCAHFANKALHHPDDLQILWLEAVERLRKDVDHFLSTPKPDLAQMWAILGVSILEEEDHIEPNLEAPLITQKLQMLHYCLYQHRQTVDVQSVSNGWEKDNIEFESCSDDTEPPYPAENVDTTPSTPRFVPLEKCDETVTGSHIHVAPQHRLLKYGEAMVMPIAQPRIPRTSDSIEAEQKLFEQLGTGHSGTSTRMWLQTKTLRDDMLHFRFAQSAGAFVHFVDFIRWHSPKDYIGPKFDDCSLTVSERESLRAEATLLPLDQLLSKRMSGDGADQAHPNVWQSMWEETGRVNAYAPEAFHPEAEAKRILSWLADAPTQEEILIHFAISNAIGQNHRMACHPFILGPHGSAIRKKLRNTSESLGSIVGRLSQVSERSAFESHAEVEGVKLLLNELVRSIQGVELLITTVLSLHDMLLGGDAHLLPADALADIQSVIGMVAVNGQDGSKLTAIQSNTLWTVLVPLLSPNAKPEEITCSLKCLAERPMNTEPTPQRLLVTMDAQHTWRVAVSLTEEIL